MSLYDYLESQNKELQTAPFYSLIMAAMRSADDMNSILLREAFPDIWEELDERYNAPGGLLPGESNGT